MLRSMSNTHPGEIVFIDGNTGNIVSRENAKLLPEALVFAETARGKVAIVKVVAHTQGDRREIFEYGENDELLRTTMQHRDR